MKEKETHLHIIFLETKLLLSKKKYNSWREIQDEYDDYKASLGPFSFEEVVSFFEIEYGDDDRRWAFTRQSMQFFFHSQQEVMSD